MRINTLKKHSIEEARKGAITFDLCAEVSRCLVRHKIVRRFVKLSVVDARLDDAPLTAHADSKEIPRWRRWSRTCNARDHFIIYGTWSPPSKDTWPSDIHLLFFLAPNLVGYRLVSHSVLYRAVHLYRMGSVTLRRCNYVCENIPIVSIVGCCEWENSDSCHCLDLK